MVGGDPSGTGERIAQLLQLSAAGGEEELRLALGLSSITELADVLDGRRQLTPSDMVAAADMLDVPVTVLAGQVPIDRHLGVSLRLGAVDTADVPIDALEYAEMMLKHQALLDSWWGRPRNPLGSLPVSTDRYFVRAGTVSAARARDALHIGDGPVNDLVGIVEGLGFPVAFRPLPEGVHGLTVRDAREGTLSRVIIISTRVPWTKQRYTLAHELCHALYDDEDQIIVDRVDVPDVLPELRAESFARAFLLPSDSLRREVGAARQRGLDWSNITALLMVRWGLSRAATLRTLIDEGHATTEAVADVRSSSVHTLMARARVLDIWNELSREESDPSGSPILVDRAVSAYRNGWIGLHVVADLLEISEEAATARLNDNGPVPGATAE